MASEKTLYEVLKITSKMLNHLDDYIASRFRNGANEAELQTLKAQRLRLELAYEALYTIYQETY